MLVGKKVRIPIMSITLNTIGRFISFGLGRRGRKRPGPGPGKAKKIINDLEKNTFELLQDIKI